MTAYLWSERALKTQRYLNAQTRTLVNQPALETSPTLPVPVVVQAKQSVRPGARGPFEIVQGPENAPFGNPESIVMYNLIMDDSFAQGAIGLAVQAYMPGHIGPLWIAWRVPFSGQGQSQVCNQCASGFMRDQIQVRIEGAEAFDPFQTYIATRMNATHTLQFKLDDRLNRIHPGSEGACVRRGIKQFPPDVSDNLGITENFRIAMTLEIQQDGLGDYFWRFQIDYADEGFSALQIFDSATDNPLDCEAQDSTLTLTSSTFTAPLDFSNATIRVNPGGS